MDDPTISEQIRRAVQRVMDPVEEPWCVSAAEYEWIEEHHPEWLRPR